MRAVAGGNGLTRSPSRQGKSSDTHIVMSIERALEESDLLAEELLSIIDRPLFDDTARLDTAARACSLSLEHWQATRILIHAGALSSALVVHRSQFEAVLRSVWLTYAASDADVAKLSSKLTTETEQAAKNIAQTQDMMAAVKTSAPKQAYEALARFKDNSWKALNSYAHAGLHPLVRHAEVYPEVLALGVLRNANGLGLMAGMQAVVLAGIQPLQRDVLDLGARYPNCMPPLL